MATNGNDSFTVGDWLVEPALNRIAMDNESSYLRPQVMELLVYLARRRGRVVSAEDLLDDLWAGKIVSSGSVYTCIAELRHALANGHDRPPGIETIPKKGYRLIAPVGHFDGAANDADDERQTLLQIVRTLTPPQRRLPLLIGAALLIAAALVTSLGLVPGPPPLVASYTQLTKAQLLFPPVPSPFPLVADNSRIYFNDWAAGTLGLRQISQAGGEAIRVQSPFGSGVLVNPQGMSPDGSRLLLSSFVPPPGAMKMPTMWLWPVVGGNPRRLVDAAAAVYSADGSRVMYSTGTDIFVAQANMSDARKIVTAPGRVYWPNFSPDGQRIRFNAAGKFLGIWEIATDGSGLHPVFPDLDQTEHCCGSWTADGKRYVFQATIDQRTQIWAVNENSGLFGARQPGPRQITDGAFDFRRPTIAPDGKNIFAVGWQLRGELVRYDQESGRFTPLAGLESLSAEWLTYSRDQDQVAFVSYPEANLWRSKNDGSDRLQLTFAPLKVVEPVWSPSGQALALTGRMPGHPPMIYVVSADGENPHPIAEDTHPQWSPSWSPDGQSLAFNSAASATVKIFNLADGTVTNLQGTEGLRGARWSPDGKYLAGYSDHHLHLFRLASGTIEKRIKIDALDGFYWSKDSHYIYYYDPFWLELARSVNRVDIDNGTIEKIITLGDTRVTWGVSGMWVGLTPDESPVVLRDLSIHHLYALDWPPD